MRELPGKHGGAANQRRETGIRQQHAMRHRLQVNGEPHMKVGLEFANGFPSPSHESLHAMVDDEDLI